MTRILVISPAPVRGGAEEYSLTVASEAIRRGWDVCMAIPNRPGAMSLRQDAIRAGIRVLDIPCSDDYGRGAPGDRSRQLIDTLVIIRLIRRAAPDVVHLTIPWPRFALSILMAAAILNVPTLAVFQLVRDPVLLAARSSLCRVIRRRRQRWVCVSSNGRNLLSRALGTSPNTIGVIHNGASQPTVVLDREAARRAVRSDFMLDPLARLILTVGRLDIQKGQLDLVAAVAPLLRSHSDLYLMIVGDGDLGRQLAAAADDLGVAPQLLLTGSRRDVPRLLAAADVFAFPSHFEGLPFSLVEAMAAGLPIVATRFPGADELLVDARDAVLVPVGDIDALQRGLAHLLADPIGASRLAEAARARATEFSSQAMLDKTFVALDEVSQHRSPTRMTC